MEISKKRATANNFIVSFIYQFITIILGFLIPQLFLSTYGPNIHGLTSVITNIMSYVLLLNAGLNTASTQALYAPLSNKNTKRLNEVLNAINYYYFKIGIMYIIVVTLLSLILPLFIKDVPNITVFLLMIVMGLQSTLDCLLVSKYRILLRADQKLYISMTFAITVLVIRGVVQILLILNNASVVIVQLIPAISLVLLWGLQRSYVKKKYPMLDSQIKADKTALSKRWSAFIHQIAGLVVNNTDVVLLTAFTGNMVLVSIYSVYQLVFSHLYSFMTTIFSQSTVASFGHLIEGGKKDSLKNNFNIYEFLYFNAISIVYSICAVMILPFVELYTSAVKNVNYADTILAFLFVIIGLANNLRVPGNTLINAGGYYKETQWRAVFEAVINISLSIILIQYLGIYGVLIGTIASFIYRTTDIICFSNRIILRQSPKRTFVRSIRVFFTVIISVYLFNVFLSITITNWFNWITIALLVGVFSLISSIVTSIIFESDETKNILRLLMKIFGKKKRI